MSSSAQSTVSGLRSTAPGRRVRGSVFVEVVRLAVVVLATAGTVGFARDVAPLRALGSGGDTSTLLLTLLGVAVGYVSGGVAGRFTLGRIDAAERQLASISGGELLAGLIGSAAGLLIGAGLVWPVFLLDGRLITVPLAAVVVSITVTTGLRIGVSRGGDLLRFLGATGRLPVSSPSRGAFAKVVDTSALIDGRLVEVCRAGFLEGTLVLPRFVLYELQGLADAADEEKRARGKRGLDVLGALQRTTGLALEVADRDYPDIDAVDAKLVMMARERGAGLVTVDANLGRIAEVQGVKVLNLNGLAETLRPPVLPGDRLRVRVVKAGKGAEQGVGYLSDGTMVVVEGGRDRQGNELDAEVTSILSNPHGRMVFATAMSEAERVAAPSAAH